AGAKQGGARRSLGAGVARQPVHAQSVPRVLTKSRQPGDGLLLTPPGELSSLWVILLNSPAQTSRRWVTSVACEDRVMPYCWGLILALVSTLLWVSGAQADDSLRIDRGLKPLYGKVDYTGATGAVQTERRVKPLEGRVEHNAAGGLVDTAA